MNDPIKNPHAFTISIDREFDVRVLENIRANVKWLETTLHEYGHAVYDKYIDKSLPFILREPSHIFTTEAVAMFLVDLLDILSFTIKSLNSTMRIFQKFQVAYLNSYVTSLR